MKSRRSLAVGLGLLIITLVWYWPVTTFPFAAYDDHWYVYKNPAVVKGLSWEGIKWAGTAVVEGNWHPLTTLSHLADCSVFGLFAGGHHLTNLLLHAVNALLVWRLFKRLTQSFWTGALVAALFAWHPLNVESVAWVAERKNVLSTFFLILTLWTYLNYVEKPGPGRYALTLGLFALGLMSKPMLVTLPCLLLLLDYWPLRRMNSGTPAETTWGHLFWEKLPFFILTGVAIIVTLMAQNSSGAMKSLHEVPLALRIFNAPVAYATYLSKAVWPVNLCVLYPLPERLPVLAAAASGVLLAAVTGLVLHWRLEFPWLLAGWFWFLGTLVPVIGIVQAGSQALADRYTYVPLLGLFLMAAGGLNEWVRSRPHSRPIAVILSCGFIVFCLLLTRQQIKCWRNSVELFKQAIVVNPGNAAAHDLLGAVLSGDGKPDEAIEHYRQAVRLKPGDVEFQYHLGRELIEAGRFGEAEIHLSEALRQMPGSPILHNCLGAALGQEGKVAEAIKEFDRAIQIQPDYPKPYFNLGKFEQQLGHDEAAATNFSKAVQLDPDWPEALDSLALLLATGSQPKLQNPAEAVKLSLHANEITRHQSPFFLKTLARTYAAEGDFSNAVATADRALKIAATNRLDSLAGQITTELKAYQSGRIPAKSTSEAASRKFESQPQN